MKHQEKINIALIVKHPVLLQTLILILENISNFSINYSSQNTLGFSNNGIDILIITEQELLTLPKSPCLQNFRTICLTTEFKRMTIQDNIVFLHQACELDELFNTINSLAKKNVTFLNSESDALKTT
jgi:hypothetical protein